MSTARAMRRQMELIREEGRLTGHVEGSTEGEQKATTEIVDYLKATLPADDKAAAKAIADVEQGKHKKDKASDAQAVDAVAADVAVDPAALDATPVTP